MTKRPLPPGFECLDSSADIKKIIDEEKVRRMRHSLNQCTSGDAVLNITVLDGDKHLYCVYKRHDQTHVTVEASKEILDWLFHGGTYVLCGGSNTTTEITFKLTDITINFGVKKG